MRVGSINNIVSFCKGLQMAIPTDIGKISNQVNSNGCCPSFGKSGLKPIAIPISDTFVHVLK